MNLPVPDGERAFVAFFAHNLIDFSFALSLVKRLALHTRARHFPDFPAES